MFAWMNNQNITPETSRSNAHKLLTPVIFSKTTQENSSTPTQEDSDNNVTLNSLVSLIEETVSESVLSLSNYEATEDETSKNILSVVEPTTNSACGTPQKCLTPASSSSPATEPISSKTEFEAPSYGPSTTLSPGNYKYLSTGTNSSDEALNSLTVINPFVVNELKAPWILAPDIESISCPSNLHQFRKAWWAGVRPTTCERTCRHRSKVCDAIQLCNDCTGYYCKWLAELIGIPVLKANGRVDPLIFHKDPLAKLYWERISKVACCPKSTSKCLMCIRRYQLFTHFLPGNLSFRDLVHRSVMRLHECGFSVDMGLIRKVTRRHLERISDNMNLKLPPEYYSSYQAYNIILQKGSLVDALTNITNSMPVNSGNYRKQSVTNYTPPYRKLSRQQSQAAVAKSVPAVTPQHKESVSQAMNTLDLFFCLNYNPSNERKSSTPHKLSYNTSELVNIVKSEKNVCNENTKHLIKKQGPSNSHPYNTNDEDNYAFATTTTTAEEEYKSTTSKTSLSSKMPNSVGNSTNFEYATNLKKNLRSGRKTYTEDEDADQDDTDLKSVKRRRRTIRKPKIYSDYTVDQMDTAEDVIEQTDSNFYGNRMIQKTNQKPRRSCFNKTSKSLNEISNTVSYEEKKSPPQQDLLHGNVLEQVAAALLKRIGSGREKKSAMIQIFQNLYLLKTDDESSSNSSTVSAKHIVDDAVHSSQLLEENRLAKGGFRGVFWEPVREAWCTLLPLLPNDSVSASRRRILSFSVQQWGSFQSAMWRAVYERVSRNLEELKCVNVSLLEELALWVKSTLNRTDCRKEHVETATEPNSELNSSEDQAAMYFNATPSDMFLNFSKVLASYKPQEIV